MPESNDPQGVSQYAAVPIGIFYPNTAINRQSSIDNGKCICLS